MHLMGDALVNATLHEAHQVKTLAACTRPESRSLHG